MSVMESFIALSIPVLHKELTCPASKLMFEMNLPEWLEAKITKAADYMNSVKDYLTHQMGKEKD